MATEVYVETPSEPAVTVLGSETLAAAPGADGNSGDTLYALFFTWSGLWVGEDDLPGVTAAWRTRAAWALRTVGGMLPGEEFYLQAQARDYLGNTSEPGPPAIGMMDSAGETGLDAALAVVKASSTISAPEFMAALPASVRLAGKNLNDFGFYVDRISGLDLPKVIADEIFVPGDHAWQQRDEYLATKKIVLEGYIHGTSPGGLRLRIAYLKSFLATFEGSPWRSRTPVSLERADLDDRHWNVFYEAVDLVETVGKRDVSTSARVRVTMKSLLPFAVSNAVVRVLFTPAAGGFRSLDLGNAPSDAVYTIRGPAENPSFTVGDMLFFCDFADGLVYTGVENTTRTGTFTPAAEESLAYRTTETGMGILVTDGNTLSYTAGGNPADGAWVVAVEPRWDSPVRTEDAVILEHRADADNLVRLFWDAAAREWVFLRRAAGVDAEVRSSARSFTAGTRIVLGITWDSSNAGGMKLYVNGAQAAVGGDVAVLQQVPDTVTLHMSDGSLAPDAVFDLVAGWSRMLSADEMLRIADDTAALSNGNVTLGWTGTLDAGDFLTIDSLRRTAERYAAATGARENVLAALSGEIPILTPGRRRAATDRTQTMIATHAAAGGMEVRYRRRYL